MILTSVAVHADLGEEVAVEREVVHGAYEAAH